MLNKVKKYCYQKLATIFDLYADKSYSQEGEDLILDRYFKNRKNGFYVDVGAHHPIKFSNTYKFYKKGWQGINIDAMPGSMKLFRKIRTRDINVEAAVADKNQTLTYYEFEEPALNGFSSELSNKRKKGNKIILKKNIKTQKLVELLDKYLPDKQKINFLSVDVEGLEIQVLKSNNWTKYKPYFIVVEILNSNIDDILKSEVCRYLKSLSYMPVAKTYNSVIFKLKKRNEK